MHSCISILNERGCFPISRSVFPTLISNDHLRSIIGGDLLSGRLGHAYILEGPYGSGKHTFARLVAASLSCERRTDDRFPLPCGECLSCRKIRDGFSPDVFMVGREEDRATLGVDAIRKLRENLWIAPNENAAKVYVIEDADTMTVQAQNAFLLSLEEPPPYAVFFLLTENAAALLETIRSRAPILRMQIFDTDALSEILKNDPRIETIARTQSEHFRKAVSAAGGSVGQAKRLLVPASEEAAAILSLRADAARIAALLFSANPSESVQILKNLPKDRAESVKLLELVLFALRDIAAIKKNASLAPLFYSDPDECRAVGDKIPLTRIVSAYDDVLTAREQILANTSVQTVFVGLLMNKH